MPAPGQSVDTARRLRRDATMVERRLWYRLRRGQLGAAKVRRQHPLGPFVVDFACLQAGLVVELDGGQHAGDVEADERRARYLQSEGFRVVRFWNHEVIENMEGVLTAIAEALEGR
ncbi:Very-short-patch-repair endonuclease [Tistlia consotensis]|uniref:Very-short-patch-repair endonuclease n=1 Tax=Tistlia consotensis USBA 355 TaxID=560819 RepID=A0A1Y6BB44_9PROT|nr:endonuclease domain-containing protein [Tistlia consotensis]SME94207.1 Very-short-patch-repair endonuclease [Tistlia consotensis USBA 355]SNR29165.1 Very-short-patch-repair endonuclease [Tistlia consotensis]